ncbi:Uma2 family endonuclease [Haliovirga abyssi]|uniref:Putative restriction endonuclease domain-containing protein n=1 Tax=Haliovirga abyssi TaxID=2996794 RepID=A0AAU9E0Q3_9FUSO|nr:Uma2 family endonuclease [Haliovirga abyssi]BDU49920.1 hypothetical protein HLVA_04890 [Haliovirga abyssi]
MAAVRKIKEKYTYENYKNWKDSEDWEIIGGKVYSMSPSPNRKHQEIASKIHGKIFRYLEGKKCKVYYELDVLLSEEDIVKPDILVVCDENKLTDKNINGAPDLVIEILSPSTAKRDKVLKYELYKKSGVKEYWIVDPYNLSIDVHNFKDEKVSHYFYEDTLENFKEKEQECENEKEKKENILEVGIFNGELKLDVNYLFED